MKRILLILATLLALSAYAEHEYIPFVENGKVWVDYDYQGNYKQVGINDTTVINQKKYHKLYKEEFCAWGGTQTPTSDSQLHGYIREEDKRVYVRGVNNEQECLIYDFGVQAGDTIEWATITYTWADGIHKRYIAVDSILTTSYYGKERNVYYVTCIQREFDKNGVENLEHGTMYFDDVWIEGIGTLQHPIMSLLDDIYRWGATGMEYFNYCYNYNTEEIFPTDKTPKPEFSYPEHEYIPYVEEGKVWVSFEASGSIYKQVSIGEPTEINNTLYNKLYISTLDARTNEITYTGLYGYIREENKKVYTRELNNQFETMIYDFDVQIGDSIQFQYGETVVDSIDTQIFYGKERDVFFVTHENAQIKDVWIEGIGSQEFPIMLSLTPNFGASGMMFHEYSYNYNTQEIFPIDRKPLPEFSYPEYEYIPFLQSGNAWVENYLEGDYCRYMITDTVAIDGKEYSVISLRVLDVYNNKIVTPYNKLYIREEGTKLLIYTEGENFVPEWSNTEHLFFDFGAQEGDSIVFADSDDFTLTMVVDSICQTKLDNKERKVYYVTYITLSKENEISEIKQQDIWIEGVGSVQTATFDEYVSKWSIAVGNSFFYCYHNYDTGYTYPEDVTMIDFSAVHTLQADAHTLTLHRVGDALVAVFPTASVGEAITLYDATGRVVATQAVRPGATTATIDVAALPSGVYIARMGNGATSKIVL